MSATQRLSAYPLQPAKRTRVAAAPVFPRPRSRKKRVPTADGWPTVVRQPADDVGTSEEHQTSAPVSEQQLIALEPGVHIPGTRYRIIRPLDDGAMGEVFEAEHIDIERRVALKVLRAEGCRTPRIAELFREEARAASRINAENIAEVYDFAELPDGRLMFAMELLSGPTLAQVLDLGAMEPARAIGITRQVCKALAAAHRANIIHRDIKPDNIVLEHRRGRQDLVKLVDFGIATMMDDASKPQFSIIGTPHYLAPEAILGQPYDGRLDIYGVGCTAYEMLTGAPPFDADEATAVLWAQVEQQPTLPSVVCPNAAIPSALEQVIMKCLCKDPLERFESMDDLEAALCEAQLAADLRTIWDDLALPDVEPSRKQHLSQYLPQPYGGGSGTDRRSKSRRRLPGWLFAATAGAGLVGFLAMEVWPTEDRRSGTAASMALPHVDARDLRREAETGRVSPVDSKRADSIASLDPLDPLIIGLEDSRSDGLDDGHAPGETTIAASLVPAPTPDAQRPSRPQSQTDQPRPVAKPRSTSRASSRQAATPSAPRRSRDKAPTLVSQAESAWREGQTQQAESLFEQALAVDSRDVEALIGVSDLHFNRGRYAKAAAYAERAVRVAPSNATARVRLGDAYFKVLRYEEALGQYRRAAALGHEGAPARAERARNKLGE